MEILAALAIKPDYAQGRHNLGLTLLAKNCPDEAIAEFREASADRGPTSLPARRAWEGTGRNMAGLVTKPCTIRYKRPRFKAKTPPTPASLCSRRKSYAALAPYWLTRRYRLHPGCDRGSR